MNIYMYKYIMYMWIYIRTNISCIYIYIYTYIYSQSISKSSCSLSATVMIFKLPKVGNLCLGIQGYLRCMSMLPATRFFPLPPPSIRLLGENLSLLFGREQMSWLWKKGVDLYFPGGSLLEGEWNGNYRISTIPVSVPGIIPLLERKVVCFVYYNRQTASPPITSRTHKKDTDCGSKVTRPVWNFWQESNGTPAHTPLVYVFVFDFGVSFFLSFFL